MKNYKTVSSAYFNALRKYITEPLSKTKASDSRQKPNAIGAILGQIKEYNRRHDQ